MKANKQREGFTLIELLIVVAIIGLLATLAVVSLTSAQQRARDTKRIADTKAIHTALELFWNDNAQYPLPAAGSGTWTSLGTSLSPYINVLPVDPDFDATSNPTAVYRYIVDGATQNQFVVAGTLEDGGNIALQQDIDGDQAAIGWIEVTSNNAVTAAARTAVYSCNDPVYCLTGDATTP